ncbi:MAG TPA: OmpH family outer membrane protein [Acetobacteraceae bacterium]|nr:OmpH family outer membrane protein [Acetobacteraceae bacterium]
MRYRRFPGAAAVAAALLILPPLAGLTAARAQQNPGWFIPKKGEAPAHTRAGRPRPAPAPAPAPEPTPLPQQAEEMPATLPQLPVPELPPLPRGASPPAAVIGVLGVPEVMRASSAAQEVEKIIGARRDKLNQDAQKEQEAWRGMEQSLANERSKLSADQIRARERALQDRITNAQKQFRDRNRIIQEAAQVALSQIERTLIAVIRQVADSRGMNLVLHRSQVALNVNEFDITGEVADQLNKVLPKVSVAPDGVEPQVAFKEEMPKTPGAKPAGKSGGKH